MILADSGFWIALANNRDPAHLAARSAARTWAPEGFISTWPVLTEACHLIFSRLGMEPVLRFVADIEQGACDIHPLTASSMPRLRALMTKYRDRPMDLADASLVVMAEDLGEGRILATDAGDFDTYRWKSRKPFKNLLLHEVR